MVGLAIALFAPASAQAEARWLSPVDLSPAGASAGGAQVAVDEQGNAVAVWNASGVQASSRPAGGVWSPPELISPSGQAAGEAQVAIDGQGNAVAVWTRFASTGGVVQAATHSPDSGWSSPVDLSAAIDDNFDVRVAAAGPGHAAVIWSGWDGTNQIIRVSTRTAGGGWSPLDLTAEGIASDPQVAVDQGGNTVAVWDAGADVRARIREAGGGWSAPQNLSASGTGQNASFPQVAVDPQGNAVAVWSRSISLATKSVQAATRLVGGDWSAPQDVSLPGQNVALPPKVGVDRYGTTVAAWLNGVRGTAGTVNVQASTRPAGGAWSLPEDVTPVHQYVDTFDLAVGSEGQAVATWSRFEGVARLPDTARFVAEAATRAVGGDWGPPQGMFSLPGAAPAALLPEVAVDGQGNAVAVWSWDDNESTRSVRAVGYDAAGPQLRDLVVPATGTVGSPLGFSVAPLDVWSSVKSTRWDFGDGTSATGNSVSHTYTAAGIYKVTVTSTDSLDNASTEERTVTIAAAPGGVGTPGDSGPAPGGTSAPATGGGELGSGGEFGSGGELGSGGEDAVPAAALKAQLVRASRFRRCLRAAGTREAKRARGSARRRCVARFGRTPGRVRALQARGAAKKVVLSFRAPGTDGRRDPAARAYLVKQSTRPIRGRRGFRRAQTLCNGSCRFNVTEVGTKITLTVTDLQPKTTYYYAVAARDNVSRRLGPRSRVVRARTGQRPRARPGGVVGVARA